MAREWVRVGLQGLAARLRVGLRAAQPVVEARMKAEARSRELAPETW